MRRIIDPLDEDVYDDDAEVELIDFTRPVRKSVVDRPPKYLGHPSHLSLVELRLAEIHLKTQEYSSEVTGLVIGEGPGPNTHADLPLFPWPPTSAGGRLLSMSGLAAGQFLGSLYRRNLVDEPRWDRQKAARRARSIVAALFEQPRELRVVLCGVRVVKAFGLKPRSTLWPHTLESRQSCVMIPHPSGLSRIYNDQEARAQTRLWIKWALRQGDGP